MERRKTIKKLRGLKEDIRDHFKEHRYVKIDHENHHMSEEASVNIFKYNRLVDKPLKVLETYKKKGSLFFKVEFQARNDGIVADPKIFSLKYLKYSFPIFLVDFFESVIMKSLVQIK